MDFGLVSVLLDSVIQASVMFNEHAERKKQKKSDNLTAIVQQLDVESVTASIRPAKLAAFMRGNVTAALVGPVINGPSFRGLVKEMFLAVVTDHAADKVDLVRSSMSLVLSGAMQSKASQADIEHFCSHLVQALTEACESVVAEVRSSNPEVLLALQSTALLKRLTAALENIESHSVSLAKTSTHEALEERRKWLGTYRSLCRKDHGYIEPPDFDTSRKIPMSQLYVLPTISYEGPNSYRDGEIMPFETFQTSIDRTVLLGDPGGGKSTLSNYLTSEWAANLEGKIPFHVTLREFAKQPQEQSIASFIKHRLDAHYQHPAPHGLVEEFLLSGEAVVVFDGLDELLDTSKRRAVSSAVELFGIKYPLCSILVTSRRIGYDQARLDPEIFRVRVISEFAPKDVHSYVHKWFSSQNQYTELEATRLASSFMEQSESVTDLRSNPLMLALMCIIFRGENFIPRNRPAVYEKCSNLLFEKWDGHRAIEVPLEARAHVNAALMYVAHWMLFTGSGDAGVPYDLLVREMSTYLRGRAYETEDAAKRAAAEFVDFCRGRAWVFSDAGTTADGEPLFTFTHRTFMEYFAAFHLTRIHDTPEKLARALLPKVAAEDWDVVAQLAIQIVDKAVDRGSERALRIMIDEPRKRTLAGRANVLEFVGRCAAFSTLSPAFMRDLATKCMTLMLQNLGQKRRDEVLAMGPWLQLTRAALAGHADTVADVHVTFMKDAMKDAGSETWDKACHLIFVGIGLTWSSAVRTISGWSRWWEVFRGIAETFANDLKLFCSMRPEFRAGLVAAGIQSPGEVVAAYKKEGAKFVDIYFGGIDAQYYRYLRVANLASILWDLYRSPLPLDSRAEFACAELLAQEFLNDFWSENPRLMGQNSEDRLGATTSLNESVEVSGDRSQNHLDAVFLIAMSEHEFVVQYFNGHYPGVVADGILRQVIGAREKRTTDNDPDFSKIPLSDRTKDFVIKWAAGKASIFEDSNAAMNEV